MKMRNLIMLLSVIISVLPFGSALAQEFSCGVSAQAGDPFNYVVVSVNSNAEGQNITVDFGDGSSTVVTISGGAASTDHYYDYLGGDFVVSASGTGFSCSTSIHVGLPPAVCSLSVEPLALINSFNITMSWENGPSQNHTLSFGDGSETLAPSGSEGSMIIPHDYSYDATPGAQTLYTLTFTVAEAVCTTAVVISVSAPTYNSTPGNNTDSGSQPPSDEPTATPIPTVTNNDWSVEIRDGLIWYTTGGDWIQLLVDDEPVGATQVDVRRGLILFKALDSSWNLALRVNSAGDWVTRSLGFCGETSYFGPGRRQITYVQNRQSYVTGYRYNHIAAAQCGS